LTASLAMLKTDFGRDVAEIHAIADLDDSTDDVSKDILAYLDSNSVSLEPPLNYFASKCWEDAKICASEDSRARLLDLTSQPINGRAIDRSDRECKEAERVLRLAKRQLRKERARNTVKRSIQVVEDPQPVVIATVAAIRKPLDDQAALEALETELAAKKQLVAELVQVYEDTERAHAATSLEVQEVQAELDSLRKAAEDPEIMHAKFKEMSGFGSSMSVTAPVSPIVLTRPLLSCVPQLSTPVRRTASPVTSPFLRVPALTLATTQAGSNSNLQGCVAPVDKASALYGSLHVRVASPRATQSAHNTASGHLVASPARGVVQRSASPRSNAHSPERNNSAVRACASPRKSSSAQHESVAAGSLKPMLSGVPAVVATVSKPPPVTMTLQPLSSIAFGSSSPLHRVSSASLQGARAVSHQNSNAPSNCSWVPATPPSSHGPSTCLSTPTSTQSTGATSTFSRGPPRSWNGQPQHAPMKLQTNASFSLTPSSSIPSVRKAN